MLKSQQFTQDFISFTLSNCENWINWEDPADWARAVSSFRNDRRKELAKQRLHGDYNDLWDSANVQVYAGAPSKRLKSVDNPYCVLWVRECLNFLETNHGIVVASLLMEIIEPFDAARLQFDGDLIKTKRAYHGAIADLRRWIYTTHGS